jgi:hypothetical protein
MNVLQATPKRKTAQVVTCSHCLKPYVLGETGTVEGCDVCLNIVRNQMDGTIISTDMEKA